MPTWYIAGTERFRGSVIAASAYAGPGDVVTGATAWYGLRAYTFASIGSNCVDITYNDATTITYVTIAGGGINTSQIASDTTTHGGPALISKLWDQTGNGNHLIQSTAGNRPTLALNVLGALPAMLFAGTSGASFKGLNVSGAPTQNPPFTYSAVANCTNTTGGANTMMTSMAADVEFGFRDASANNVYVYGNGAATVDVTTTMNAFHALQGIYTGSASSSITVDGSNTSPGTNPGNSGIVGINIGSFLNTTTNPMNGYICEIGIWPGAFTIGGQDQVMNTNQHNYWGF